MTLPPLTEFHPRPAAVRQAHDGLRAVVNAISARLYGDSQTDLADLRQVLLRRALHWHDTAGTQRQFEATARLGDALTRLSRWPGERAQAELHGLITAMEGRR